MNDTIVILTRSWDPAPPEDAPEEELDLRLVIDLLRRTVRRALDRRAALDGDTELYQLAQCLGVADDLQGGVTMRAA
jgi:hypothetical protein